MGLIPAVYRQLRGAQAKALPYFKPPLVLTSIYRIFERKLGTLIGYDARDGVETFIYEGGRVKTRGAEVLRLELSRAGKTTVLEGREVMKVLATHESSRRTSHPRLSLAL